VHTCWYRKTCCSNARRNGITKTVQITSVCLMKFENENIFVVARMGEPQNAYRTLMAKACGRWMLGRQKRRWKDNIRTLEIWVGRRMGHGIQK